MGLDVRLNALKQRALATSPNSAEGSDKADKIEHAGRRLVAKTGMGREYKVLGIVADGKAEDKNSEGEGEEREEVWPFVGKDDV